MTWFVENLGTIIVCMILVAVVGFILYNMIKRKRKGMSSCGCNCSTCPAGGTCHGNEKKSVS